MGLEVEKIIISQKRRYIGGFKYCARCRVYYLTDDVRCPVCRVLLRSSPRKKRNMEKPAIDPMKYL